MQTRIRESRLIGVIISAVLLFGATTKLEAVSQLFEAIELTTHWSKGFSLAAGMSVIGIEILAGIGLLFLRTRCAALYVALALFAGFSVYNLWRLLTHSPVPCSCFGVLLRGSPGTSLSVSTALLAAALLAITNSQPLQLSNREATSC